MTPLRQRMTEDRQARNLSLRTQESYLFQVSRFARHFHRSPALPGPEEIRAYQIYLTQEKKPATASILLATAALRFLYQVTLQEKWNLPEVMPLPRKPQKLPVILNPEEALRFLGGVMGRKEHAILTTCYAAGLRITEVLHLKPTDIDSQRMVIRVEQGKGHKDRYVMLSPKLLETLRNYWRVQRPRHWLFPGGSPGRPLTADAAQKACRQARLRAGLAKPMTPHLLRHAFAVHLLESGADIRTIQLLLGHRDLATTARYLRIATSKVCSTTSPLDLLPRLEGQVTPPAPPRPEWRAVERPKLEVADAFRHYGEAYRQQHGASMSSAQQRVMTAIEVCRTAASGGHVEECDHCGINASVTTPAAIVTAPSASRWPVRAGSRTGSRSYWTASTSTWCSPCQNRWPPWPTGRKEFRGVQLSVRLAVFRFMATIFQAYRFPIIVQTLDPESLADLRRQASFPSKLGPFNLELPVDAALFSLLAGVKWHLEGQPGTRSARVFVDEGYKKNGAVIPIPPFQERFCGRSGLLCSVLLLHPADPVGGLCGLLLEPNAASPCKTKRELSDLDKTLLEILSPVTWNYVNIEKRFVTLRDCSEPMIQ